MILKSKNKKSYIVYKIDESEFEVISIWGSFFHRCSFCNKFVMQGTIYYIPLYGSYFCEECYKIWENRTIYAPESFETEQENSIKFENECSDLELKITEKF